jgi:hypothetical protein
VQQVSKVAVGVVEQPGEQVSDLVRGQRDESWRCGGLGLFVGGGDGEEGVGEQREDGSAVPRCPAADLMFVQAGQSLTCLERLLDRPAVSGHGDQGGQWHRGRC